MSNRNFFKEQLALNDLVAAPMAGISSPPFRLMLRDFFDGIIYTEMVSVEGVQRDNPSSMEYLDILEGDRPVVAQLFGGNADAYPKAVEMAEKYSTPDAYDVNMGCPVKKVIKTGGGCALLRDTENIAKIIRALRSGTEKAFSVKFRTGWDDTMSVYMEILDIAQTEGADAVILHGRTRTQMFGGKINYDAIAELAEEATIPVIGNGNVCDYDSYIKMKQTGVDGVMVGRAMMSTPWVFKAIREKAPAENYFEPARLYEILIKLYGLMKLHAGDCSNKQGHYLNIIKKYSVWFSKGLENAAQYRAEVYKDNDETRFMGLMERFYKGYGTF